MGKSIRSKAKKRLRTEKREQVDPYERQKLDKLVEKLDVIRQTNVDLENMDEVKLEQQMSRPSKMKVSITVEEDPSDQKMETVPKKEKLASNITKKTRNVKNKKKVKKI